MTRKSEPLKHRFNSAVNRATSRILKQYPQMIAIILNGSVARKEVSPYSDVDILGIMGPHHPESFAYFDQEILVGLGFVTLNQFKKWSSDVKEFYWQGVKPPPPEYCMTQLEKSGKSSTLGGP